MKKILLIFFVVSLLVISGCVGAAFGGMIALDRKLCKDRGIKPNEIHPLLRR